MTGDAPVPLPDASFPTGLLIALIVLVFLSGFFSAAETAFTSVNKIKLRTLAGNGNSRAKNVLSLAENKYDKLISVLLVGNNIVNLSENPSRKRELFNRFYRGYYGYRFDFQRDYP